MAIEIRCINKINRTSPYERILFVGGVNPDGTRWKRSEADAIAGMKRGEYEFYVNQRGLPVGVIIAKSQYGNEYLKTVADGETPNNLLSLSDCP